MVRVDPEYLVAYKLVLDAICWESNESIFLLRLKKICVQCMVPAWFMVLLLVWYQTPYMGEEILSQIRAIAANAGA